MRAGLSCPTNTRSAVPITESLFRFGETAEVIHQSPDVLLGQVGKGGHGGIGRAVPDDPEQLPVG